MSNGPLRSRLSNRSQSLSQSQSLDTESPRTSQINLSHQEDRGTRGDRMTVDMHDIRRRLDRLRVLEKHPIRLLIGQSRDDYIALVNITRLLHGSSLYSEYYSEIVQRFGNISSIVPGTVGAYFVGCLPPISVLPSSGPSSDQSSRLTSTCSAICADSIPTPDMVENGGSSCSNDVFLAITTDAGYDFVPLVTGNFDHALVFVDGSFSGFTSAEKAKLRQYASPSVMTLSIYRVSPDGKRYTDLSQGRLTFDEIPTRVEMIENFSFGSSGNSSGDTGQSRYSRIYLVVIAVLILLIFLAWYFLF